MTSAPRTRSARRREQATAEPQDAAGGWRPTVALWRVLLGFLLFMAAAHAGAATYSRVAAGFSWVDPSSHTDVTWSGLTQCTGGGASTDDDLTAPVNLGFTFKFGSASYTQVRIMSNGRLQFTSTFCGFGTVGTSPVTYPYNFPATNLPDTIRVYGADLDPSSSGSGTTCKSPSCAVRFAALGSAPNRSFVVTWVNVPEWNQNQSSFNLQIILYENGEFVFQYGVSTNTSGGNGQAGWQLSTSDFEVSSNTLPANNSAVRFWIPPAQAYCIPAGYVLDAAVGNLTLGNSNTVNGSAVSGSGDALLSTGARTTFAGSATAINPASFPSISGSANGNSSPVTSGTYSGVSANTAGFTLTGGTYLIQNFNVNTTSLTFAPGDYFIQNFSLSDNLTITVSPAGPVRLFLTGSMSARNGVTMNAGGSPSNLQVFVYGNSDFRLGDNFDFTGVIYGPGGARVEVGNNGTFTGAVLTTGQINTGNNVAFTYSAATQSSVASVTTCTASGPTAFVVTSASTASTCANQSVTIRAVDSLNNTATTYTGTVNLTTSTSRGGWAAGASSGSVVETGTSSDGAASYTFRTADAGQVTLNLSNQSADNLTITARDSVTSSIIGTSGTVSFRDNAFVVTSTDTLANTVVAGRPHAMGVTLFQRDTSLPTPNCSIATNYTGARTLKAWFTADPSHPAGASAPTLNSSSALGTAVPGTSNLTLTFTAGAASFTLGTTDVGKYVINLRDDTRTFAGAVDIDGSSPTLTVRPFALAITGIAKGATVNPEGSALAGSRFVAAGDTFSATVSGYLWQAADDANNDGIQDAGTSVLLNGLTPRFAWATTLAASNNATDFSPTGGTLGTLGGTTSIASGAYSAGAATVSNLTYSEVGSIGLTASVTSYLNTTGVNLSGTAVSASTGQQAKVGRFYPDHFTMVGGSTATPYCGTAAAGFTYMDQPALGLSFTIEARSVPDTLTTNYRGGTYNVGTVGYVAENADAGTDLRARLSGLPTASWSSGSYAVTSSSTIFTRPSGGTTTDGPYESLIIGVTVTDPDGAVLTSRDMNASSAGCGAGCTAKAINSTATRVRFGRLRIANALGSPVLPLPVALSTEYWNGTGFIVNAQDNCTRLTNTNISFSIYQGALAACNTSGSPTGANAITFSGGRASNFKLSAPGAGRAGSVDLTVNLNASTSGTSCSGGAPVANTPANMAWLLGNWGATSYNQVPTGRAAFGLYTNTPDIIYLRENY